MYINKQKTRLNYVKRKNNLVGSMYTNYII